LKKFVWFLRLQIFASIELSFISNIITREVAGNRFFTFRYSGIEFVGLEEYHYVNTLEKALNTNQMKSAIGFNPY
jgi:hypothetical protein